MKTIIEGRAWKFGENVSTDLITSGRYAFLRSNLEKLAEHTLEDANPKFAKEVKKNDIVVAGKNFGMGSSREHAAVVFAQLKVGALVSPKFARIFFRNAINTGLPLVNIETDDINDGDELKIDLGKGVLLNKTSKKEHSFLPLPKTMLTILSDGGLVAHIKKNKDFKL